MGTLKEFGELEPDKVKSSDLFTLGPHSALLLNFWDSGDVTVQVKKDEPGEGITIVGKIRVPKHVRGWLATQLRKKERGK